MSAVGKTEIKREQKENKIVSERESDVTGDLITYLHCFYLTLASGKVRVEISNKVDTL